MSKYQLIKIDWEDSRQPVSEWLYLEDYEKPSAVICQSIGWLIHDGKDVKAIAQNIGDADEKIQVSGVMQIPVCSIKKITEITSSFSD